MPHLHRLIYVSSAVGGSDVDLWALTSILNAAERNNRQHDLTGLLLVWEGMFCQVLEGPHTAIEGLMRILQRDRRHTRIRILCDEPIQTRLFSHWSMAQAVLTPELTRELTGVQLNSYDGDRALDLMRRAGDRMAA